MGRRNTLEQVILLLCDKIFSEQTCYLKNEKTLALIHPRIRSHSRIITVHTDSRAVVPAIIAVHSAGEGSSHQMLIWQI